MIVFSCFLIDFNGYKGYMGYRGLLIAHACLDWPMPSWVGPMPSWCRPTGGASGQPTGLVGWLVGGWLIAYPPVLRWKLPSATFWAFVLTLEWLIDSLSARPQLEVVFTKLLVLPIEVNVELAEKLK